MLRKGLGSEIGLAFFYLGLGMASALVWARIANMAALPGWHYEMITATAPAPNQYRPLTPWLAEFVRYILLRGDIFTSYLLVRGLITGITFYLFDRYLRVWFNRPAATAGALALAAILPFTYFRVVQESDPLNLLAFTLAFWMLAKERYWQLIPIVLVGTLNRETTALIPVLYLISNIGRRSWREVLPRSLVLGICWTIVYGGLLLIYGRRSYYCDVIMWQQNISSLLPTVHLLVLYGALWFIAVWGARKGPLLLQRALWSLPLFLGLHYVVAMIQEVRLFLPYAPVIIPLSWWVLFPEARLDVMQSGRKR